MWRKNQNLQYRLKELRHEVKSYLGIKTVKNVRVLIRYDVENLSDATFERNEMGETGDETKDYRIRTCMGLETMTNVRFGTWTLEA